MSPRICYPVPDSKQAEIDIATSPSVYTNIHLPFDLQYFIFEEKCPSPGPLSLGAALCAKFVEKLEILPNNNAAADRPRTILSYTDYVLREPETVNMANHEVLKKECTASGGMDPGIIYIEKEAAESWLCRAMYIEEGATRSIVKIAAFQTCYAGYKAQSRQQR